MRRQRRKRILKAALAWELAWGNNLEFLIDQDTPEDPSPALWDRPSLSPTLRRFFEAYLYLRNSTGGNGWSANPIPLSEVESYCRVFDFPFIDLLAIRVRALDSVFILATAPKEKT